MAESPVSRFTYRAFISYSHCDKAWADWLHKALETWRVPSRLVGTTTAHGTIPRRLNPVFRDREELSSSPELGTRINEALSQSENLVVLCSPASATSRWVNEEVLAYKRMGRADRIFCVIVDGEPNASDLPGREAEECFCPALRFATDADGRPTNERAEPIAADARLGKDGRPNAKLKLIAGMLDVGFDALKQREQRRQIRRMTAIAGTALVVMAVTIVLAVAALVSRHRAVIAQRAAVMAQHKAVVAQQAAVRRQKQAEGLVDFMLGDLTAKLWQVGRLDVMKSVNNKAMAYFESLPPTDVNDTALEQRAKALEKIGGVALNSDSMDAAIEAFQASARISSRLAAAKPDDVARQVAYSRTLTFLSLALDSKHTPEKGQEILETAERVLQVPLKKSPDDQAVIAQLFYVENSLGVILYRRGLRDAAESKYHDALLLARKLAVAQPDKPDYAQALAQAHDNLASLAMSRGDIATAVAEDRASLSIQIQAFARDPGNKSQENFVAQARATLGNALALTGDTQSAARELQQALDTVARLSADDPSNTSHQLDHAVDLAQLARLERLEGSPAKAMDLGAKAATLFHALAEKDPDDIDARGNYADIQVERAMELSSVGKHAQALASARSALDALQALIAKNPDNLDAQQSAMRVRLLLASLGRDGAQATALREQALQAFQSAPVNHGHPDSTSLEVQGLLALHRLDDARPLIRRLWNAGYRDPEFVASLQREHIDYPANADFPARLAAATARVAEPESPGSTADAQGAGP